VKLIAMIGAIVSWTEAHPAFVVGFLVALTVDSLIRLKRADSGMSKAIRLGVWGVIGAALIWTLGVFQPDESRAIQLVQTSKDLFPKDLWDTGYCPSERQSPTDDVVRCLVRLWNGKARIEGWRAKPSGHGTYIVSYTIILPAESSNRPQGLQAMLELFRPGAAHDPVRAGWVFEADLEHGISWNRDDDAEAARLAGIGEVVNDAKPSSMPVGQAPVTTQREQTSVVTKNSGDLNRVDDTDQQRALELVKASRNVFPPNFGELELGRGANNDTEHLIRRRLAKSQGEVHIDGWTVRRSSDQTFLVVYGFSINGEPKGFPFEVNTSAEIVRYVIGDSALERKYGWEQTSSTGGESKVSSQPTENLPVLVFNSARDSLTLKNKGDTKLTDCQVGVDRPSNRGGPSCRDCNPDTDLPGRINHTMLADSVMIGGDWLEANTTMIETLRPNDSIDVALSTFRAYRDRSLFAVGSEPWGYVVCKDATGQDRRVTVAF
jgi:hypothetical protein